MLKRSIKQSKIKNIIMILILNDSYSNTIGGMEISFLQHIKLLDDTYCFIPVNVIFKNDDNYWYGQVNYFKDDYISFYNINISDVFLNEKNDFLYNCLTKHIINIARLENVQIMHVFGAYQSLPFSASVASLSLKIPLMISFRGSDFNNRLFHSQFAHLEKAIESSKICIFVNKDSKELFLKLFPNKKALLIYNFLDENNFELKKIKCIFPTDNFTLGCLGNFRRSMGTDFLLDVFNELSILNKNIYLLLIGDFRDNEKTFYNKKIQSIKNKNRIRITGKIPHNEVLSYINLCNLMVFPSITEGCPNKIIESMYLKKAIIASDISGIRDLIENEKQGILVNPFEKNRFKEEIIKLMNNPDKRNNLGLNANLKIMRHFNKNIALKNWSEAYKKVLCL